MPWKLLMMEAPMFGGDMLYNAIAALVVFLVGVGILMKTESKTGWIFIIAAIGWAYLTFKELINM
jgi:hypothetical protein